jgi:RNA polymerase sigma-70 factor (ECF subfamily)
MQRTDAELVAAWLTGDQQAFAAIYERYADALYGVCSGLLRDRAAAADVVHDTFVRAASRVGQLRRPERLRAWLFAIARNVCADHVRRRTRRARVLERLRLESPDVGTLDEPSTLDDMLDALDDDRREAFVATQVLGLSYAEASDALGCPIGTVRSRVSRARRDLLAMVRAAEAR